MKMEKDGIRSARRGAILLLLLLAGGHLLFGESTSQKKPPDTAPSSSTETQSAAKSQAKPSRPAPSELQKAVTEFRLQASLILSGKSSMRSSGRQNKLSGRLFEYLRNDIMDAIPHEVNQNGGTKSLLRRNQFGFNVSGPVFFPKFYDGRGKSYFSLSYEGTRERIAQSHLFTLPTSGQQQGNFADLVDSAGEPVTIFDPATTRPNPNYNPGQEVTKENLQYLRDPFANNQIPRERMDPVALAALKYYTLPNTSIGPFLDNNYWVNSPYENRADGIIAKVDHSFSDKQQMSVSSNISKGSRKSPAYYPGPGAPNDPGYDFFYRSLSVQHTYSISPKTVLNLSVGGGYNQTISTNTDTTDYASLLGFKNSWTGKFPAFRFGKYLALGSQMGNFWDNHTYFSASSTLSSTRKDHTLTLSLSTTRHYLNTYRPSSPGGLMYFSNALTALPGITNTGNSFASFLLGMPRRGDETIVVHPSYYRKPYVSISGSDEYRIRPGWNVSFNLSYNSAYPQTEKYNRQSTVSMREINPQNGYPGALIFAGQDNGGKPLQPTIHRLEPVLTLAVNPWNDPKTVIRLRGELNYQVFRLYGGHFASQGFNSTPAYISGNEELYPAFHLRDGLPRNFAFPPNLKREAANGTEADYIYPTDVVPITTEFSLSIQRELPFSMVLRTRVANWRTTHAYVENLIQLNPVSVENLSYRDLLYDDAFRQTLRPMPQYRRLEFGGAYPGGDVSGNSMSLTLDKRLSGGLYGNATYRLSKQIDNTTAWSGPQNPANLQAEMSISPGDVTHSISLNYTYDLPFGKGKSFLNDGGVLGKILGAWSLSGISTLQSGPPLSIYPLFNHTGGVVSSLRVNVVPGISPKISNPGPDQWFNPEAFSQPEDFTLGNASRTHPQLRGPGYQMHHLSLTRRLRLKDETSLEILTEAFNFPNHANWNDPDTRIGPEDSPNLNAGKIIGARGGRVMQCGLRFLF